MHFVLFIVYVAVQHHGNKPGLSMSTCECCSYLAGVAVAHLTLMPVGYKRNVENIYILITV